MKSWSVIRFILLLLIVSLVFYDLKSYAQTSNDTQLGGSSQTSAIQDYLASQQCTSSQSGSASSAEATYRTCRDELADQALKILNTCGEAQFSAEWATCANGGDPDASSDSASGSSSTPLATDDKSDSLHSGDPAASGRIFNYIKVIMIVLSAAAGLAIVGSFVVAGVQYATAGENTGSISKAKTRIVYTVIVLIVYMLIFSIITWLIPGSQIL
jgi:hypothetical protein